MRIDYDGKWKILIEKTPQQFIEFFLPEIASQINFQIPPKLMQQDVAKEIGSKRKKGDLVTDIIMEVCLLSGKKKLLYIHIEVQSTPTIAFGEKMFKPFYRLMDKYNQEVTALALFVGEYLPQKHDHYEYSFGKTLVRYEYPTYIVKNQDKEALKASKNPYAIAILACQYLIETKNKELYANRLSLKKELIDFIVQAANSRGYTSMTSGAIIDFVLNIMILPEQLETHFINYCHQKYKKMENPNSLSKNTIAFADVFFQAVFKESYESLAEKFQIVKEATATKLEAEKEAKAAKKEVKETKLKAEKEVKETKLKAEKEVKETKLKAEKEVKETKLKAEKETKAAKLKAEKEVKAAKLKAEKEVKAAKLKAEKEAKETKLKAEKEVKAAKLKAEKEAKETKLKAEKKVKAARLKTEKVICKLHFEQKLSSEVIALIVEEADTYVQSVIAKNKLLD